MSKSVPWQLYIRHAHRETYDRDLDNGISEKGHRQVERLVECLEALPDLTRVRRVFTSPKLRCWQTAEPLGRWAGCPVEERQELDEQGPRESHADFTKRVNAWIKKVEDESGVLCVSHGDWIPCVGTHYGRHVDKIHKGDFLWVKNRELVLVNGVRHPQSSI